MEMQAYTVEDRGNDVSKKVSGVSPVISTWSGLIYTVAWFARAFILLGMYGAGILWKPWSHPPRWYNNSPYPPPEESVGKVLSSSWWIEDPSITRFKLAGPNPALESAVRAPSEEGGLSSRGFPRQKNLMLHVGFLFLAGPFPFPT